LNQCGRSGFIVKNFVQRDGGAARGRRQSDAASGTGFDEEIDVAVPAPRAQMTMSDMSSVKAKIIEKRYALIRS
jgi:hypothetical protein